MKQSQENVRRLKQVGEPSRGTTETTPAAFGATAGLGAEEYEAGGKVAGVAEVADEVGITLHAVCALITVFWPITGL